MVDTEQLEIERERKEIVLEIPLRYSDSQV